MTDETHDVPMGEPVPPPDPVPTVEERDTSVLAGAGDFTSGEGLVAFAGIVVVATWVIFDVLVADYGVNYIMLLLGVAAAVLPRLDRGTVEKLHPLPLSMKVIGFGIALIGLFALIEDLRFVGSFDGVGVILGALATYAAAVMAFLGARQIPA